MGKGFWMYMYVNTARKENTEWNFYGHEEGARDGITAVLVKMRLVMIRRCGTTQLE